MKLKIEQVSAVDLKAVYILQERKISKHVIGLKHLCATRDISVVHAQFSIVRPITNAVLSLSWSRCKTEVARFFETIVLFLKLLFGTKGAVVVGIAPFDLRLVLLVPFLIRHDVYFHTSWPSWGSGDFVPKARFRRFGLYVWNSFLPRSVSGIFCVSMASANSIQHHFPRWPRCHIVHHSIDYDWFIDKAKVDTKNWNNSVAYVGRLVPEKGINDLLDLARALPHLKFNFVGEGVMEPNLRNCGLDNVILHGFINDHKTLLSLLDSCDVIVQPSRSSSAWVEAFGLGVLEGMARGLMPITTESPGSLSVLGDDLAFLASPEALYQDHFRQIMNSLDPEKIRSLRSLCAKRAAYFNLDAVSKRWEVGLSQSRASFAA